MRLEYYHSLKVELFPKMNNNNVFPKSGNTKSAFTLAEVLITLGIIGVVAAMTIPTLIANTNSAKFRTQFKKTISTLSQAALMSKAQYGFDYSDLKHCGDSQYDYSQNPGSENPEEVMSVCSLLNGTLTGYTYYPMLADAFPEYDIKNDSYKTSGGVIASATKYHVYSLSDGSFFAFYQEGGSCELALGTPMNSDWIKKHPQCYGFIDVNGRSLPNKVVTCTDGTASTNVDKPCVVKNDAQHMTDIYPVIFHDSIVEPATDAAKYVLMTAK